MKTLHYFNNISLTVKKKSCGDLAGDQDRLMQVCQIFCVRYVDSSYYVIQAKVTTEER